MPRIFTLLLLCALLSSTLTHAGGTLSERTYKRLTVIHQLMGDSKYKEAMERLNTLLPKVRKNGYEYATVMQTLGFAYAATDQYSKAIEAFEKAISQNALPEGVQLSMQYNIAQLYATLPDYKAAAKAYEAWFAKAESPSADTFVFAATVYAQMKNYNVAIEKIKQAISMSEKPKESWYQLLVAMYYEKKQYANAADVLEILVASYPEKKKYWKQLAGTYFSLKRNTTALSVMELANKKGHLSEEKELMNLVNMYLYQSIPYKAAQLLEKEINAGRIPKTQKNLQKLAEAWMRAQENDAAIDYMVSAADAGNSGKLYLRASQLYLEKEDWPKVIEVANKAIASGNLDDQGTAHLVLGMALYESGQRQKALAEFRQGTRFDKSKKQANQWIVHISNEG